MAPYQNHGRALGGEGRIVETISIGLTEDLLRFPFGISLVLLEPVHPKMRLGAVRGERMATENETPTVNIDHLR